MGNFQAYFSRTFQDLKLQFPGLSRTKVIFQDFPGPGILKKKIQDFSGFSRRRGNPDINLEMGLVTTERQLGAEVSDQLQHKKL